LIACSCPLCVCEAVETDELMKRGGVERGRVRGLVAVRGQDWVVK
jgi:hypothetical protein